MTSAFHFEPLNPIRHRREEFSCESPELTTYLQTRARKEMEARVAACFVLVPVAEPGRIAGFYTLSAAEVLLTALPPDMAKKLPRYPSLPVTLLGRLARDTRFRGQGIGDLLMADALRRAWRSSAEIGSIAVVTDPKDERAAAFYRDFGFLPLDSRRLLLPMKDLERWLRGRDA